MAVDRDRRRVRRAEIDGRAVWIKRHDTEGPSFGESLHALVSPVLHPRFWRASRIVSARDLTLRELRKLERFRAAGIAVPEVVFHDACRIATADAGPTAETLLKGYKAERETEAHERLLVEVAAALGAVHRAGLCHGRPHLRDCVITDGRVIFIDLEQEPEAVMPLSDAQARDVWLLFFHVASRALLPETPARALEAYRSAASDTALRSLRPVLASMRWMVTAGRFLARIHSGGDLRRFLAATVFLLGAFDMPGGLESGRTEESSAMSGGSRPDERRPIRS